MSLDINIFSPEETLEVVPSYKLDPGPWARVMILAGGRSDQSSRSPFC
jgi:hypothetical protein